MQIKRFEAQSMAEAFRMIKSEFGPDAVILSARHVKKGTGLLGVTRTVGVEVTAAIDAAATLGRGQASAIHSALRPQGAGFAREEDQGVLSRISKRGRQLSQKKAVFKTDRRAENSPGPGRSALRPVPPDHQSSAPEDEQRMIRELENHGVDPSIVAEISREVRRFRTTWPALADEPMADMVLKVIEAKGFSNEMMRNTAEGRVQMFIGPAGCGKSTVLSKLVVKAVVDEKMRVGIVTLDDARMGAVYQLKAFARILNVPVVLTPGPAQFTAALEKMRSMDRIFIDTPGIGGKDSRRLAQIHDCVQSISPDQIFLILSAVPAARDLDQQVERFLSLNPTAFIFTRFDETTRWGGAFSQLMNHRLPIAYVTAGQEIPEDIGRIGLEEVLERVLSPPMELSAAHTSGAGMPQEDRDRRYGRSGTYL